MSDRAYIRGVPFATQLVEIRRHGEFVRVFESLAVGSLYVSIQGSTTAYCEPRCTLDDPSGYMAMEVAIIDAAGEWFRPEKDERFAGRPWAGYWRGDDVAGYVPVADIEAMLADLAMATP